MASAKHKPGSALLLLLIAVAIVAMLYMVNLRGLFGPALSAPPRGIEERPWLLEDLLIPEGRPVALPKPPKPVLHAPLTLSGPAVRNDAPRGDVRITLAPDGRVRAVWQAAYTHPPKQYQLEASAAGNIDLKQTCLDADGRDTSHLFFIARGPYRLITDDPAAGRTEETGTVWLLGCLRPDRTAHGTLTLTTDQQWATVYPFTARPETE